MKGTEMTDDFAGADSLDDLKECKFHIPLHLHLKLHRHRLLSKQSISDTVSKALDQYFQASLPKEQPPEQQSPGQYGS